MTEWKKLHLVGLIIINNIKLEHKAVNKFYTHFME